MLVLNLRLIKTKERELRTISKCENNKNRTPAELSEPKDSNWEQERGWNEKTRERVITGVSQWWSVWRAGSCSPCWPSSGRPVPTCPPTATSTSSVPASWSPAWVSRTTLRMWLLWRPFSPSSRLLSTSGTSPALVFLLLKYQVGDLRLSS